MSQLPLSGIKLLDLIPSPEGSSCAQVLGRWGAERIPLPPGLDTDHPEGKRILLLLVQEVDVLVYPAERSDTWDLALLQEYNPMLIACSVAAGSDDWVAASGILAALLSRERSGLGQAVTVGVEGPPSFSGFTQVALPAVAPDQVLSRLGYDPEAIATLRRSGVL